MAKKRAPRRSASQTVFRVACRDKPYAQIGNAMLQDRRLSFEARGALAAILSRPPNWHFNIAWLAREGGIGRDKTQRIIRELIATGYCWCSRERDGETGRLTRVNRDAAGRLMAVEHVFSDVPHAIAPQPENPVVDPQPEKPALVQPALVPPAPVNPQPTKTDSEKHGFHTPPPAAPDPAARDVNDGGAGFGAVVDGPPAAVGSADVRFTVRWDRAARSAVAELADSVTGAHMIAFFGAFIATLHPPAGADGASWIRQVAHRLRDRPPDVLERLAQRVVATQVRDVPAVARMVTWADEVGREIAAEAAERAAADARRASQQAALARLAPGVEPDAAPPRQDALALRRAFVATAVDGAAIDAAWFGDLLVVDRTGPVLRLSVTAAFNARYIASSQLHGDLVAAARTLWPAIRLVECAARDRRAVA